MERKRKTPDGVNIEQRIATGLTKFFTNEDQAKQFALEKRSYHYPVLEYDDEQQANFQVGFCVPK